MVAVGQQGAGGGRCRRARATAESSTALVEQGSVRAGQTVVVQGTGGVSLFGLQLAAAHGAEVIVVSGDDAKLGRAKDLGAAHGINRTRQDWVEAVYEYTDDRGADHILEVVGAAHLGRSIEAAAVGGPAGRGQSPPAGT